MSTKNDFKKTDLYRESDSYKISIIKYQYALNKYKRIYSQHWDQIAINAPDSGGMIPSIENAPYIHKKIQSDLLNYPDQFVLKNRMIYYVDNIYFAFNKANYKTVFQNYGLVEPPQEFIDCLYQRLLHGRKTSPYWKYIHYKAMNNCPTCIFDALDLFRFFEGNVFFSPKGISWSLLDEKTYKLLVNINNELYPFTKLKQPTLHRFKSIAAWIKESIKDRYNLTIEKNENQVLMQHIVKQLQQQGKAKSVYINMDYINAIDVSFITNEEVMGTCTLKKQQLFFRNNPAALSANLIDYLFALTNGEQKAFDQLAETIARINVLKAPAECPKTQPPSTAIPPKITVIATSNIKLVTKFFSLIYGNTQKTVVNIPKLCNLRSLPDALQFKLDGGILYCVEGYGQPTEKHLKLVRKLARSIPVTKRDRAVDSLTYISNCHYVLIANNQKQLNIYKGSFRQLADIILLKDNDLSPNGISEFSSGDFHWIRTVFATYGLLLLIHDSLVSEKSIKPIEDTQQIINDFIKECCIISPEADCYADELYAAYTQYFLRKYGVQPIKRTHLIKHLTSTGKYLHCRPRHSAKDNRWGLKGISLRKDGVRQDEVTQDDAQIKKENLLKQINKINEIIFPLLELGPAAETETEKQSDKSASDAHH